MKDKLKIEIWSDIACPFCYIGKRTLEMALAETGMQKQVEIEYKSFQLDPEAAFVEGIDLYETLAERKGWTIDQAKQISNQVVERAAEVGVVFNMAEVKPANTLNAHRLLHLAKMLGVQIEAKELLLNAYFTTGQNISDWGVLETISDQLNIPSNAFHELRTGELYKAEVENDIYEARTMGVSGVPCFVFERKYGISGAQPQAHFVQTLKELALEKV
jgi:predicted DsbA family dithiol-disulfide isomerase